MLDTRRHLAANGPLYMLPVLTGSSKQYIVSFLLALSYAPWLYTVRFRVFFRATSTPTPRYRTLNSCTHYALIRLGAFFEHQRAFYPSVVVRSKAVHSTLPALRRSSSYHRDPRTLYDLPRRGSPAVRKLQLHGNVAPSPRVT